MLQHQDSAISKLFRSFIKWIYHFFTGTTQIQRKARQHDLNGLQYSLLRSKVLSSFTAEHCNWQVPYNDDLASQLCALKNIGNEDASFRVKVIFEELYCWRHALKKLEEVRQTKYDSSSQTHEKTLLQVWERLRPLRPLKARKSVEWIELGFQAEDPATDFRGSGLLGLLNLHVWVGDNEGKQTFAVADSKGTDYFFASASIFLTMLSIQLVRESLIPAQFWTSKHDEKSIMGAFQAIFQQVFREFNIFWRQTQDKSMMQFNINLLSFSKKMKGELVHRVNGKLRND